MSRQRASRSKFSRRRSKTRRRMFWESLEPRMLLAAEMGPHRPDPLPVTIESIADLQSALANVDFRQATAQQGIVFIGAGPSPRGDGWVQGLRTESLDTASVTDLHGTAPEDRDDPRFNDFLVRTPRSICLAIQWSPECLRDPMVSHRMLRSDLSMLETTYESYEQPLRRDPTILECCCQTTPTDLELVGRRCGFPRSLWRFRAPYLKAPHQSTLGLGTDRLGLFRMSLESIPQKRETLMTCCTTHLSYWLSLQQGMTATTPSRTRPI